MGRSAFNTGDAAAVAASPQCIEDAYVLPVGARVAHGRDDIQKFRAAMQQLGDVNCAAVDVKPLRARRRAPDWPLHLQNKGRDTA